MLNEPSFTKPVCKGSFALGSACGTCERCEWEKKNLPFLIGGDGPARPLPEGSKLIATTDVRIVNMIEFRGLIILATEKGVYKYDHTRPDDGFVPMKIQPIEEANVDHSA